MMLTKLKAKNQVTIPVALVKRLGLKKEGLLSIEVEDNHIILTPVTVEPEYTKEELEAMEEIFQREKSQGKAFKTVKELNDHLEKLSE